MSLHHASRCNDGKHSAPDTPSLRALCSLMAGVVVICALYFGRAVLIPITLAGLLSFELAPFVDFLRRLRLGQVPSVLVAVLLAVSCLTALGALIGVQVEQLSGDLPRYEAVIERKVDRVEQSVVGRADSLLSRASATLKRIAPLHEEPAPTNENPTSPMGNAPLPVEVHEPSPSPVALAQRFLSPVVSPLETAGIMLVVSIFVLVQREDLRDRLIRLFGARDLYRTTVAMDEAARRLSRYFLAQLGVNMSVGSVAAVGLAIIGVPGALLFGVLTTLLRFVPYVGTWIAAALAAIMAAAASAGWSATIWTLVLFGVTELLAAQLVEPVLYGRSTGLSPFAVIVAAIFWSWVWGPVGLVLSTPLTLCLVILGRHFRGLEFLDVLFGDRPALTPAQNFYQRLLANDPGEAFAQAASLSREHSLCAYYDAVALEGLRHARNDLLRGVLTPEQLRRIKESTVGLIERLDDIGCPVMPGTSDDVEPYSASLPDEDHADAPATKAGRQAIEARRVTSVLCVSGRGKLDGLVAAIALQLLRKRGLPAARSSYERFSRERGSERDASGGRVICVISLDAAESPPYLRSMLRRLAQIETRPDLIVGLAAPDTVLLDDAPDRSVVVAATFEALVDACVEAALRRDIEARRTECEDRRAVRAPLHSLNHE